MPEHIVILSGAGISAESGLATFRGQGGLWEQYSVYDLATPEAFQAHPDRVLRFYNERRNQVRAAQPNAAHKALAALETGYRVSVVTQNVDDLHERAGSSHVLHLHGEILKARSSRDPARVYALSGNIELGDLCDLGSQLRPDVVWFGEAVPRLQDAAVLMATADRVLVVGTSLEVYPAASLLDYVRPGIPVTVINPDARTTPSGAESISATACEALPGWVQVLLERVN